MGTRSGQCRPNVRPNVRSRFAFPGARNPLICSISRFGKYFSSDFPRLPRVSFGNPRTDPGNLRLGPPYTAGVPRPSGPQIPSKSQKGLPGPPGMECQKSVKNVSQRTRRIRCIPLAGCFGTQQPQPSQLSGVIRANRFARFVRIGWFARIGNSSESCEVAWCTINIGVSGVEKLTRSDLKGPKELGASLWQVVLVRNSHSLLKFSDFRLYGLGVPKQCHSRSRRRVLGHLQSPVLRWRNAMLRADSWDWVGRGWGLRTATFQFQSPAVHWMARTSSLNCLSCRNPFQTPHSLNRLPPFHWKIFFYWKVLRRIPFPPKSAQMHVCESIDDSRGTTKPTNIKYFSGLSREWVGANFVYVLPFPRGKKEHINKIARKSQEHAGQSQDNPVKSLCMYFFLNFVLRP